MRTVGVTVGKFNPPHLGHLHLVETGAAQVDRLYVLLGARPDQTLPAADRAAWLAAAAPPNVTVIVTPDDLPAANEPWAQRALQVLPQPPEVGFTSEPWGPGWCAAMGAEHVAVDPGRERFPISATEIRADLRTGFEWLVPPARTALARRIVTAGAESSGKTTLAAALAAQWGTTWVPEYGRTYWEGRRHRRDQSWATTEFHHIATTHHTVADGLAAQSAAGLVVLDTDALVTRVWHRRYLGTDDCELAALATVHRPDFYVVCAPDFDWAQDGTRESAGEREAMHRRTLDLVAASGVQYEVLAGDPAARLRRAMDIADKLTTFDPLI